MQFEIEHAINDTVYILSVDADYTTAVTKDKHLASCPEDLYTGWELNSLTVYDLKGNIVDIEIEEEKLFNILEKIEEDFYV